MGVASLVLGIFSVLTGWIPFICFAAFGLAIVGLILGIVDVIKKTKENKKRGISIAGLVISAIAIPLIICTSLFSLIIFGVIINEKCYDKDNYTWNERYDWKDDFLNSNYDELLREYNMLEYYDTI